MAPNAKQNGPEVLAKFQAFDRNRDGNIDRKELGKVLQSIDRATWTPQRLDKLFRVMANENGLVQYEEFVAWAFGNGGVETKDLNNFRRACRGNKVLNAGQGSRRSSSPARASESAPSPPAPSEGYIQSSARLGEAWVHQPCGNGVELVDSAPGALTFDFAVVPDGGIFINAVEVELVLSIQCNADMYEASAFRGCALFYSLDGSKPSPDGAIDDKNRLYDKPFTFSQSGEHVVHGVARLPSGEEIRIQSRFVVCNYCMPEALVSGIVRIPKSSSQSSVAAAELPDLSAFEPNSPTAVRAALGLDDLATVPASSADEKGGGRSRLSSADPEDAANLEVKEMLSSLACGAAPDRHCSVKLGVAQEFWICEIWEHGDWLQVRCRFLLPWKGSLRNASRELTSEKLSSMLGCDARVLSMEPGSNKLVNLKLELWPLHAQSSGKNLAALLQKLLEESAAEVGPNRTLESRLELEADPEWGDAFGASGGNEEQNLRDIAARPSFARILRDALVPTLPAITEVVLAEGCVSGDGEGVVMDVAVRSAQNAMARSDFFHAFKSSQDSQRFFVQAVLQVVGQVDTRRRGRWLPESHLVLLEGFTPAELRKLSGARYFVEIPPILDKLIGPKPDITLQAPISRTTTKASDAASSAGWGISPLVTNAKPAGKGSPSPREVAGVVAAAFNTSVQVGKLIPATPSRVRHLSFELRWGYPSHGKDFLDCSGMAFVGDRLVQLVDYRAGDELDGHWKASTIDSDEKLANFADCNPAGLDAFPFDELSDRDAAHDHKQEQWRRETAEGDEKPVLSLPVTAKEVSRKCEAAGLHGYTGSVCGTMRHSGDVMDDSAASGKQVMQVDLALLPRSVSHLFFALSARKSKDLSLFPRPSLKVFNAEHPEHRLTQLNLENLGTTQASVVCYLSRALGPWVLEGVGSPSGGNVSNYDPIFSAAQQAMSSSAPV